MVLQNSRDLSGFGLSRRIRSNIVACHHETLQDAMLNAGVNLDSLQAALPEADRSRDDSPRHDSATLEGHNAGSDLSCRSSQCSAYSESDSDLPPLRPNKNRPIREFEYTDDETSSDDGD